MSPKRPSVRGRDVPTRQSIEERNAQAIAGPVPQSAATAPSQPETKPVAKKASPGPRVAEQEPATEDASPDRPPRRPRKAQSIPPGKARLGIYLHAGTVAEAKSAFIADLAHVPAPPTSFAEWVGRALDSHTSRTLEQRAALAQEHPDTAGTVGENRAFILPEATIQALKETAHADLLAGRGLSASQLAAEALRVAIDQARTRNGGTLPPPPARLPTRLSL